MSNIILIGALLLSAAAGAAAFYFFRLWRSGQDQQQQQINELQEKLHTTNTEHARSETALQSEREQRQQLNEQLENSRQQQSAQLENHRQQQQQQQQELQTKLAHAEAENATLTEALKNEQQNSGEKLKMLQDAQQEMAARFKNLAQDILEEKSKKFSEDSRQQLGPLLDPLKENIDSFRIKIEALHGENTKERSALHAYIEQLQKNTNQISADADNLTQALKGSSKVQGDWGEQLLHKLLENSGLMLEEHYRLQPSYKNEEGGYQRPDAVIDLPEGKHLIIDAKISLSAYAEYNTATDEAQRAVALKNHIKSVRNHVKDLHGKKYNALPATNSPDFVLLFMGLEPAYILAMQNDHDLFTDAYKQNIVLTSPTTLMPILRTVAHIWRLESQQRHAQEISLQGGKLYDKFIGFVEDMNKLGDTLGKAQKTYDSAYNKLSSGRGNLVGHAEKLRHMGVDAQKKLPAEVIAGAVEE
ncbi:MAG: DNA recombination protein RmuC [Proteobacteria bacterium]|nr:DNA recombination protein RmuC [Pseudomonadota bacterium]